MAPVRRGGRHRVLVALALAIMAAGLFVHPTRADAPPHMGYGTTGGVQALRLWLGTSLLSSLPGLRTVMHTALLGIAAELGLGARPDVWPATLGALVTIVLALGIAALVLRRQEL